MATAGRSNVKRDSNKELAPLLTHGALSVDTATSGSDRVSTPEAGDAGERSPLPSPKPEVYSVYGARWWVLIVYSWLSASQCAVGLTFGPISEPTKEEYDLSNSTIGLLALYAPVAYLFVTLPVMWLLDHPRGGLRRSFFIAGAIPHLICGALRCAAVGPNSAWVLHIAQMINGGVGVVALSAPAKVAHTWFSIHERVLATGIITLANAFGAAVGFIVIPAQVAAVGVYGMLLQWAGITAIPLLLGVCYLPEAPRTPPSRSAAAQVAGGGSVNEAGKQQAGWTQQLIALSMQRDIVLLCVACGLPNGFIAAMMNVLGVVLGSAPWRMTDSVALRDVFASSSWLGTWATALGVLSGIAIGPVSYRLMRTCGYRALLLVLAASMLVCFTWFAATASQVMPGNVATVQLSFIAGNTLCSAALPLFIELACEVAYPLPPALVNGFMQAGYSAGIVVFLGIGLASNVFNDYPVVITWLTPVGTAITLLLLLGVTGTQKRMDLDVDTAKTAFEAMQPPLTAATSPRGKQALELESADVSELSTK